MSKKTLFLVSFVLVLGLSTLARADAIEVNNPSFEIADDGVNTVPGHTGYGGVLDWSGNYPWGGPDTGDVPGWVGVDVFCPAVDPCHEAPKHCHRWPGSDGGVVYSYLQNLGTNAYQVLDLNNSDVNGIIIPGRKYLLTVDALVTRSDAPTVIVPSLFYVEEVCQPDVNHHELASESYLLEYIERALEDCDGDSDLDPKTECPDWNYDLTVQFVAETSDDCIGKTLGIKFTAPHPDGERYSFIDNIRVDWSWASSAYGPDPPDEGEDAPMDVDLSWSPGLWATSGVNGHEVYFGTSLSEVTNATTTTAGIYRGSGAGVVSGPDANNRYSYDSLETLELGKTYYWRIDEVNKNWAGGPVPPVDDRWKGDVWSFRTTGVAYNVYPADKATDIPALGLTLLWQAGTDAETHDVYFGTSESEVENATTATAGIFRGNQPLSDVNYPVETLEVRRDFFWRIDEVNTNTSTLVKGDVWKFRTGQFLIVDGFEWYPTDEALKLVWKDYWSDTASKNGGKIFIENDVNFIHGGEKAMKFTYMSNSKHKIGPDWVGSWAKAEASDLEVGTDWTVGGVKALVTYFIGDPCNGKDTGGLEQDRLWVALDDGTTEGVVAYDGVMTAVTDGVWHEWNVSLEDSNFSGVDINNVAYVLIGAGGTDRVGQSADGAGDVYGYSDSVYFDDIQLWPPRCMPVITGFAALHGLGDFIGPGAEGDPDCNTNYLDLELIAKDWTSIDGLANTENRPAVLTDFTPGPNWIGGRIGTGAIEVNHPDKITVKDTRLAGLTSLTISAWVKLNNVQHGSDNHWSGIVTSREQPTTGATVEIGIYGGGYGGPGGKGQSALGYDWSNVAGDAWKYDAGLDVPDMTWTFVAVSVDPTGATLYMQPDSGSMSSGRNVKEHPPLQAFAEYFRLGQSNEDGGYLEGWIDDVRIYGYNLDDANIAMLADETGEPTPPPVYWYELDDGAGLSAADSGTPIQVYTRNMSPANLVPKDPCESEDPNLGTGAFDPNNLDIVNFEDYRIFAEHWLEKHPWP